MKQKGYILAIVGLSLVCIGLGVALYFNSTTMSGHADQLENVYQKSFYELIDNINSIEVEVSKVIVSNDFDNQKSSIQKIKQDSADAQSCLSYLPINSSLVYQSSKFINQLNGFCLSVLNGKEQKLTDDQMSTWEDIYNCIANLKYELNQVSLKVSQGYSIIDNLDKDSEIDAFSQNFSGITSDSIEYPSMIYDGPFSDGVLNQEINGLDDTICSQQEAYEYVEKIFENYDVTSIKYNDKTSGKFKTYNFTVKTSMQTYYVQITEKGKFLLNISGFVGGGEIKIAEDKAISITEDFATKLGLKNMRCVWKATSNNITYINLAPVIEGVIYYSDLIKVKVDRTTGNIMGWEASNYAYNHTSRSGANFSVSESEVISNLSSKISVVSLKKCLIPLEYGGENFAYEICGKYNNFTYYLYFDASTGKQIKVMRVIQTADGELLL